MAQKKAAKKLAAEMQRRQMQKDFLLREQALDKETSKKLQEKWFGILLDTKLPEMKENLRSILDYMEKLVEVEVYRKRLFEEEKNELNEQITLQTQSHSRAIEYLYELYVQRIEELREMYNNEVEKRKEATEKELRAIKEEAEKNEDDLRAIIFQMEVNREKKLDAMKCQMFFEIDDEKSKIEEKNQNLWTNNERIIEKGWHQISTVLTDYEQRTKQRRNHYLQLQARDKHDSKIIQSQTRKTQKLTEQIQQLKNALENPDYSDPKTKMVRDYREERARFYNSFKYMKMILNQEMKMDENNLKKLSTTSKDTIDYLDYYIKKGEKILTAFSLCLKLETEKEKIVPVGRTLYNTKIPPFLVKQMPLHLANETSHSDFQKATNNMEQLKYLWQKFCKADLSRYALMKVISDLKKENHVLKSMLHSYFGEMSL